MHESDQKLAIEKDKIYSANCILRHRCTQMHNPLLSYMVPIFAALQHPLALYLCFYELCRITSNGVQQHRGVLLNLKDFIESNRYYDTYPFKEINSFN